jgi:hypothetical protein
MRKGRVWSWLGRLFRTEKPRPAPQVGNQSAPRSDRIQTSEPRRFSEDVRRPTTPERRVPSTASTAPPTATRPRPESQPARSDVPSAVGRAAAQRSHGREKIDLVIGLDFGTAATKVVIRSPFMRQRARAVSFGDLGHSSSRYLLPTRLRVGREGQLAVRADMEGQWVTDLKIRLLDRASPMADTSDMDDRIKRAAAYLALVLREAKARFLTAEREAYARFDPRWALNVGIPSAGYDDETIRRRFLRAARAGWSLSLGAGPLTWDSVTRALQPEDQSTSDAEIPIEVVPEVAAQAVGYARSTLRDPGLHLLVDVGASTFDVCGFVLHEREGQDRYELLTATVAPLGVLALHRQRLGVLQCRNGIDERRAQEDPLIPVGEALRDYHPGCPCKPPDIDAEFSHRAVGIVMGHLMDLRGRRDPRSQRWKTGLPVFLCGGGSGMRLFRKVVDDANTRFCSATMARGILRRTLPRPEHLVNDDVGDSLFHRLSVAYGLSFDALDIGGISPPHESPDLPRPRRKDPEDRFISKDQV